MDLRAKKILDFWFIETPAEKRFKKDEKFDQIIKEKFLKDYELAAKNKLDHWQDTPKGCLALIILLDQAHPRDFLLLIPLHYLSAPFQNETPIVLLQGSIPQQQQFPYQ